MKEEKKVLQEEKRKGRGRFECKEKLDKSFPLDLDWQYLNAHTLGYCLHSLKAQNSAIYSETAFVVDSLDVSCLLSTEENKKDTQVGFVPLFSLPFCEYQQMSKAGKHNFDRSTIPHQ